MNVIGILSKINDINNVEIIANDDFLLHLRKIRIQNSSDRGDIFHELLKVWIKIEYQFDNVQDLKNHQSLSFLIEFCSRLIIFEDWCRLDEVYSNIFRKHKDIARGYSIGAILKFRYLPNPEQQLLENFDDIFSKLINAYKTDNNELKTVTFIGNEYLSLLQKREKSKDIDQKNENYIQFLEISNKSQANSTISHPQSELAPKEVNVAYEEEEDKITSNKEIVVLKDQQIQELKNKLEIQLNNNIKLEKDLKIERLKNITLKEQMLQSEKDVTQLKIGLQNIVSKSEQHQTDTTIKLTQENKLLTYENHQANIKIDELQSTIKELQDQINNYSEASIDISLYENLKSTNIELKKGNLALSEVIKDLRNKINLLEQKNSKNNNERPIDNNLYRETGQNTSKLKICILASKSDINIINNAFSKDRLRNFGYIKDINLEIRVLNTRDTKDKNISIQTVANYDLIIIGPNDHILNDMPADYSAGGKKDGGIKKCLEVEYKHKNVEMPTKNKKPDISKEKLQSIFINFINKLQTNNSL